MDVLMLRAHGQIIAPVLSAYIIHVENGQEQYLHTDMLIPDGQDSPKRVLEQATSQ